MSLYVYTKYIDRLMELEDEHDVDSFPTDPDLDVDAHSKCRPRHKNHVLRHPVRLLTVLLCKRSHTLSRKH